jgi:hypothetical protein
MFFLLRMTFWLGIVCILLPGGGGKDNSAAQIDTLQAVSAAGAAYSDMRGFCDRQAGACEVGGQVATVLGHRATEGAKTIVEFISTKMAEGSPAPRKNGSSQDTLTTSDAAPAWQGPAQVPLPPASPRREAQNRRPSA